MRTIMDYFEESVSYPNIAQERPINTLWEYVGAPYVLNQSKGLFIMVAVVVERYEKAKGRSIKRRMDWDDTVCIAHGPNDGERTLLWFDQDTSDCMIGTFVTDDSPERIIELFFNYLDGMVKENEGKQVEENYDQGVISYDVVLGSVVSEWITKEITRYDKPTYS